MLDSVPMVTDVTARLFIFRELREGKEGQIKSGGYNEDDDYKV